MPQPGLATDCHGVTLLDIERVQDLNQPEKHTNLLVSMVVMKSFDNFLLVFNRNRAGWEIPGGRIEVGESPLAAAERELFEESGQTAANLKFEAIAKFLFLKDQREILGAVYSAYMDILNPFTPNSEISQITLWDGIRNIGYIDEIDLALVRLIGIK